MNTTAEFVSSALDSPHGPRNEFMKKPEMQPDSIRVASQRGRYANLLQQGTNIAVLDADLLKHFPDSASVNNVLRAFLAIGQQVESASTHVMRKSPRSTNGKRAGVFDPRAGSALKRRTAAR
jgi:hypothetical protein